MNSVFIVLPILTLLMFNLGLTLQPADFVLLAKWIRTARQNVLNVYSGKPYDLIWAYG